MIRFVDWTADALLALCLLLACAVRVVIDLEECRSCAAATGSPAQSIEIPMLRPTIGG